MAERPEKADQLKIYEELTASDEIVAGEIYCAVSYPWLQTWRAYCTSEDDVAPPSAITNGSLSDFTFPESLRRTLVEDTDHKWIPERAFKKLAEWYGCDVSFPRKAIEAADGGSARIDAFPQVCIVRSSEAEGRTARFLVARGSTASNILQDLLANEEACRTLSVTDATRSELRVWAAETDAAAAPGEEQQASAAPAPAPSQQQDAQLPQAVGAGVQDPQEAAAYIAGAAARAAAEGTQTSALAWALVAGKVTMEGIARNDPFTHVFLERRRADGSWPRGCIYAPGCAPQSGLTDAEVDAWRASLTKGSRLDAIDKDGNPAAAIIVGVKPGVGAAAGDKTKERLEVRFVGWAREYNETIPREDADRFFPLFSRTQPWKQGLRVGDWVEYCNAKSAKDALMCVITSIDHTAMPPQVGIAYKPLYETKRGSVSLEDPSLGPKGTSIPAWQYDMASYKPDNVPAAPTGKNFLEAVAAEGAIGCPDAARAVAYTRAGGASAAGADGDAAMSGGGGSDGAAYSTALTVLGQLMGTDGSMDVDGDDEDDPDEPFTTVGGGKKRGGAVTRSAAAAAGGGNQQSWTPQQLLEGYQKHFFGDAPVAVTPTGDLAAAAASGSLSTGIVASANAYGRTRVSGVPGVCGLDNLGNTCFMNSMLQCMSNTMELTNFFTNPDTFLPQVNQGNKMGMGGRMATAYAALVQAIWSGKFAHVAPNHVKALVGKKNAAFLGYGQQDSQEFMSFFLDALLEDTCRVQGPKPYITDVDTTGKSEAEIAALAWSNHLRRNDSIVTDVFSGQFRSHVQCNICHKSSITFDPFNTWSVPIPVDKWESFTLFYFGTTNTTPVKYMYWYRQADAPSAGDLAVWLTEQVKKDHQAASARSKASAAARAAMQDATNNPQAAGASSTKVEEEVDADEAAVARASAVVPEPHELLVTLSSSSPCMVRMVLPHWASMQMADKVTRDFYTDYTRYALHVFVFHVPGSPPYPKKPATAAQAADSTSAGGAQAAAGGAGGEDTAMTGGGGSSTTTGDAEDAASTEGAGATTTSTAEPDTSGLADSDVDWPFDYREPLPSNDDDDDGWTYGSRKPKQIKYRQPGKFAAWGPRPVDFTAAWLRGPVGKTGNMGVLGDSLVIPTHYTTDPAAVAAAVAAHGPEVVTPAGGVYAARITNAQFHKNVWDRMQRLIKKTPTEEEKPAAQAGDATSAEVAAVAPTEGAAEGEALPPWHPSRAPYRLGFFGYNYHKRMLLPKDYTTDFFSPACKVDPVGLLPFDDEPYVPQNNRQLLVDFTQASATKWFDFPEAGTARVHASVAERPAVERITLDHCFRQFSKREQLGENDKWYCGNCKDHVRAFKHMELWRAPPVLIVHLKRFQYERGMFSSVLRGKLNDPVEFPTRGLDLSPYIKAPTATAGGASSGGADGTPSTTTVGADGAIYDLYAVSEHSGGMGGGHYTAHGFNAITRQWYDFNDSWVSEANEKDCVRSSAYVLFYRRRAAGSAAPGPVTGGGASGGGVVHDADDE